MRSVLPLPGVVLALVLLGCGGDRSAGGPLSFSDPLVVATRAVDALRRGDFAGLVTQLDDAGRFALTQDLDAARKGLADSAALAPGVAAEVRLVFGAAGEDLRERAAKAPPHELFRFLSRVRPVGGGPEPPPVQTGPGRVTYTYRDVHGVARAVVLVQGTSGWRVRAIDL